MATGSELFKKAVPDGTYGAFTAITTQGNIFKKLWEGMKMSVVPPMAYITASLITMRSTLFDTAKAAGGLESALKRIGQIKGVERQFDGLLKSLALAKQRTAELVQFSQKSGGVFNFGDAADANRTLQIMTKGLYASTEAMERIGDSATKSGNSIGETAGAYGELVRQLEGGQVPVAVDSLRDMGVVSEITATKVFSLASSGASLQQVMEVVNSEMDNASGSTKAASQDYGTLQKKLEQVRDELSQAYGSPFKEGEIEGTKATIATLERFKPVVAAVGGTLAQLAGTGRGVSDFFSDMASRIPVGVFDIATKSVILFVSALAAIGAVQAVGVLSAWATILSRTVSIMWSATSAARAATAATEAYDAALVSAAMAETLAAEGETVLAAKMVASTSATMIKAGVIKVLRFGMIQLGAALTSTAAVVAATAASVAIAGAALWAHHDALQADIKAINDLASANQGLEGSLSNNNDAMQTEEDQMRASAQATDALVAAKRKLNELDVNHNGGQGLSSQQSALYGIQSSHVSNLQGILNNAQADRPGLAVGSAESGRRRERLERESALNEMQFQNDMQNAPDSQKRLLIANRSGALKDREGQANIFEDEQRRLELAGRTSQMAIDQDRAGATNGGEAGRSAVADAAAQREAMSQMRRESTSPLVRGYQHADDLAAGGNKGAADTLRQQLDVQKELIMGDRKRNQEEIAGLAIADKQLETSMRRAAIDLDTENQLSAMREEGLAAARTEDEIRVGSLNKQMALAEKLGDLMGVKQAKESISAIQKAHDLREEDAANARASTKSYQQVAVYQRQAAEQAALGNFASANSSRQKAIQLGDAQKEVDLQNELRIGGQYGSDGEIKAEAHKRVEAEKAERASSASIATREYQQQTGIEHLEGTHGRGRRAALQSAEKLKDLYSYQDQVKDLMFNKGLSGQDASMEAARRQLADIGLQQNPTPVASSLQAIGGGGGVGESGQLLSVAQRQASLLEKLPKEIAAALKGSTALVPGGAKFQ